MSEEAPLGNFIIESRICNRWIGGELGSASEQICGKQATRHVMWSFETLDNSFVCEEHADEAAKRWRFFAAHDLGPCCGMPGSLWMFDENVCRYPDDELPVAERAEREVPA